MFGLFSPKQMLGLLADEIEKQRNTPIEKYVMIYQAATHSVLFQLNDDETKLPLDNPALADGIKMMVGEKVQEGWALEYAFVFYKRAKPSLVPGQYQEEVSIGIHTINAAGEKMNEKLSL